MNKVQIIADSCSDLTRELLEKYSIDYAKMSTVLDGKESPALLTWSAEEAHSLYETIRGGKRITTAQVSVEEFNRVFEKHLKEGRDIVYIACSSKQSGSVNTANVVAKKLSQDYPEQKISCIDSLNASLGIGMLCIEAAKLASCGKSIDEITEHIMSVRKKVNQFVTVHTLEHLKKAGRVSASSAFFGNLMGVKPILISDVNGTQVAYKKVKGRQASLRELVSLLKTATENTTVDTVYLAHADCSADEVCAITDIINELIGPKEIIKGIIGPIIGASIGPDAVGVWAFGEEVTFSHE